MAAEGKLRPIHQISKDRYRWVLAMQVKGLSFEGGSPDAETASLRSAVVLEAVQDTGRDRPLIERSGTGIRIGSSALRDSAILGGQVCQFVLNLAFGRSVVEPTSQLTWA